MAGLTPGWRKASYSVDNGNANCVEVGGVPSVVLVRDTTDQDGGTLAFDVQAWRRFAARIREADKA
jgi:Domain of unknown function (DUF397)